jgi:hypothetical protein
VAHEAGAHALLELEIGENARGFLEMKQRDGRLPFR